MVRTAYTLIPPLLSCVLVRMARKIFTAVLVALAVCIGFVAAGTESNKKLDFDDVDNAFRWAKEAMSSPAEVVLADPGFLDAATSPGSAGFTAYIIENFQTPKTNVTLRGLVAQDNILNQSISQLMVQTSMAPTVKTPTCSYTGPLDGGKSRGQVSFYMVQKQLVCKRQPSQHQSLALKMLSSGGYKFIGYSFINNMLAAGYAAQTPAGDLSAIFVSVFDGHMLAMGQENKAKSTMAQVLFLTYNNARPQSAEVSLPGTLSALCP